MWVARDKNGRLFVYGTKPHKIQKEWRLEELFNDDYCEIDIDWFPEVKWEDEEPRELILK